MGLETGLVILNVVFLLIAAFSIPFLFQLWRMAKNIAITLQTLNCSLPGILQNLEEVTSNIVSATETVNSHIEGLSSAIKKIQGTLDLVGNLEGSGKASFFQDIRNSICRSKGCAGFPERFSFCPLSYKS